MAYSRWSNSRWYTYWSINSGDSKDSQVFQVCSVKGFTYRELKEDMSKCIREVIEEVGGEVSDSEVDDLRGCMNEFIKDVEGSYEEVL